ncbi:MAG: SPOR domain-containing protein [Edaphobacter sp.]
MNTLYTRGTRLDDDHEPDERDREISLGTSFIVGIFFALVLICAIFFAFGYSLGRRSALPASGVVAAPVTGVSASKPASGIPEAQATSTSEENSSDEQTSPAAQENPVVLPAKLAVKSTQAGKPAAPSVTTPGSVQSVVQVAAVSRQGDAAMLMSALKRKGYNAAIHQTPQDKLLHVQIGPFSTKKDAEAMRQRLISDGYNAIVK